MKYRNFKILAFALIIFSLSSPLKAQIFKGMIIGGVNFAQMNGDQTFGYNRLGLNTGIGVMAPLNSERSWLMSMEVLYNELGAKESLDPFKYNTKVKYVSIPLIVHFEDKVGRWTFGAGLQYSRLVDFNEDWGLPEPAIKYMDRPDLSTVKDFNRDDFSFLFDIRFRIWERLKFNFRYQYSIVPIRKDVTYYNGFPEGSPERKSWKRDFYHNALTLRLIYVINERSTKELDRNINRDIY